MKLLQSIFPESSSAEATKSKTTTTTSTSTSNMTPTKKKIAIIGGGAAGMATAYSLSAHKEDFDVTIIDPCPHLGGVACTKYIDDNGRVDQYPSTDNKNQHYFNYGVQGGSPAAHQNIIEMMKAFGEDTHLASLSVSFGKGKYNWKNYSDSELQKRLKKDIQRFEKCLKWISRLEFITIFMSIDTVLGVFGGLSQEFRERMVYPLVALFFGSGNKTPYVSAAIVARVFFDPSMALFEYSPDRLLDSEPTNFAFGNLQEFYNVKMRQELQQNRGVTILSRHKVSKLVERSREHGVTVEITPVDIHASSDEKTFNYRAGNDQIEIGSQDSVPLVQQATKSSWHQHFDEVVFACAANVALDILGEQASFWERRVLGAVQYSRGLSVTHYDEAYMKKHFEVDGRAIYFIKTYEQDPKLLEMAFDISAYQPGIQGGIEVATSGEGKKQEEKKNRVYQTIFLQQRRKDDLWTMDELDKSKILDTTWWSSICHDYFHFRHVVPWVWILHRNRRVKESHTYFCGSWTFFNTHDIAVVSGLAVADRLGAPYPFAHNAGACRGFDTYYKVAHRSKRETVKSAEVKKYV